MQLGVLVLALVLFAPPLATQAQQPGKIARLGLLGLFTPELGSRSVAAVREGLGDLGWHEGQNIRFEHRYASGKRDQLGALAAELVQQRVDVIVAFGTDATRAARGATLSIPIVMGAVADPVGAGFVTSLARPGGNVTGLSILATDMAVKRLEVLKEALPRAGRIAVIVNPRNPSSVEQLAALRAAAPALSVQLQPVEVGRSGEYADAFAAIARARADAVIVLSDPEFFRERRVLVDLAAEKRTPAAYEWREFVEAGGFMSYGSNFQDVAARAAVYVDRILRGAKPAELPVEQPTKFELAINLKTARALGLTIPQSLLQRADQVIE